jgi:hypothetical protein
MSFVAAPSDPINWVQLVPLGHLQYALPSSVRPVAFAQRHVQYTALSLVRSVHCGETAPFPWVSTFVCERGVVHPAAPFGPAPVASCPYGQLTRPRK